MILLAPRSALTALVVALPLLLAPRAALAAPLVATPPDAWQLFVFSVRLLRIEAPDATEAYDRAVAYRLELVRACIEATDDRTERYICVKVARFESSYREDVGRCEVKGAAGELTAWQIIPRNAAERARLCHDLTEDARVHLERVRESRAACRSLPKTEQLALYARGDCGSAAGRKLSRHRFPTDVEVKRVETERW